MPDVFLKLSAADRREALAVAAAVSGRPLHLLDKDVWLVWLLDVLFRSPFGEHLVFKGGSSLSKGYQIISRFSEDVDLTYDIRALAPDLSGSGLDPLPATRSQEKRWTKEIRSRRPAWITEQVVPRISAALRDQELTGTLSAEGERLFLEYAPLAAGSGYVRLVVMLNPRASHGNLEPSHAMQRRVSPALYFHRQAPGSCARSGPSGRRPRLFTSSVGKASFVVASASRGTGTI
ncbi:MAG: nucleotidyl transferase AbiEii/AbiGii toxin family protein [Bryobacteraceae bacterium]|nr:nucleotidyl transferase AbiEii/AbiGii toxin family protein [Bryobacteraceae bacterium]